MRHLEINIIGYKIPNSDDIVICKMIDGTYAVQTSDGVMTYDLNEIKEIYNFDPTQCERLGWPA